MNKFFIIGSFFCAGLLYGDSISLWQKQLNAAGYLEDPFLAVGMATQALNEHPNSIEIKKSVLQLLGQVGEEKKMLMLFRELPEEAMSQAEKDRSIELMAWAVIAKGAESTSPPIRAISLLAAAYGNDARGVKILKKHLADPNHLIRLVTVQLCAKFRDRSLQEAVYKRLIEEKDTEIRLALISAVGDMQIRKAKPELLHILENSSSNAEETGIAVESLLAMSKSIEQEEISRLADHPRACIRELAAALIAFQGEPDDAPLLIKLINDPHPIVRRRALEALGGLRVKQVNEIDLNEILTPLVSDQNIEVSLTASWVMMLHEPQRGQFYFRKGWERADNSEKLYATGLLLGSGLYAFPLASNLFEETDNFFLKVNLAMAMLHADVQTDLAMEALHKAVSSQDNRWMKKKWGRFAARAPSDLCHRADIPRYPEVVNQIERLEVLNELAQRNYSYAQKAIAGFLKERLFGVSGAAAFLLLSEGDDSALELIKCSLNHCCERIRLQAALALGILGSDPSALTTLQTLYAGSSRDQKEQIIEAMGKIADRTTLPFMIDRLYESQQMLRIIAAAGIIQTLYE